MGKKVLIAVDGSGSADHALVYASSHLLHQGDELHLVSVMPPTNYSVYPVAPVATAAAVAAVTHQWEAQRKHDEEEAAKVLKAAVAVCLDHGVHKSQLHAHALPAAGGASGVAESIVEFAAAKGTDMVVVGSRGLGAMKRSLMSLVGLGSVSDYCIQNLHVPVLVVRADAPPPQEGKPRTLVLALDDSPHSTLALDWAMTNLIDLSKDIVHVVSVALPMPYPILDETSPAVAAMEAQQWQASAERCLNYANQLAATNAAAVEARAGEAPRAGSIVRAALLPEGGASDVGAAIAKYATDAKADLVVVGSRGMGSFKASIMGFVGLGSVSSYLLHHLGCPVAVVKATEEAAQAAVAAAKEKSQAAARSAHTDKGVDGADGAKQD